MSNFNSIKATINANIKANGNQEITGPVLNSVLTAMVNALGDGYQYAGIAIPTTNPGTPDNRVFYIATNSGTYTHFGGIIVYDGEVVILTWDTEWHRASLGLASAEELERIESDLYGVEIIPTQINYQSLTSVVVLINANNKWDTATTYKSAFIRVQPGQKYKIIKNSNPGVFALLRTNAHVNGTTPDFSAMYPSRILGDEMPDIIEIPSDTNYICVRQTTSQGLVNAEIYRLDEVQTSVGIVEDVKNPTITIQESDLTGLYPFYINATTKKWVTHANSAAYTYSVKAGQKVTIKANSSEDASIAFIAKVNTINGSSVEYANGTTGNITQTAGSTQLYNVTEDCYLYIFRRGASLTANRFPELILIGLVRKDVLMRANFSENNGPWEYFGERPTFSSKSFGQRLLASLPAYTGHTGLHQGMAVYGDYLVLYTYNDTASPATCTAILYNIPSATKLAEINLPYSPHSRPHGNVLSFGKGLHSSNSITPPLYISQWDETGERGVLVYDIIHTSGGYSASLIQAIVPNIGNTIFGNGAADWVVDADNDYLYSVSYQSTNGSEIDNDSTNATIICKFNLPALTSAEVTLTEANIVEDYRILSLPYRQDICIAGGLMMIQRGNANVGHADWLDVHFLDLASRTIKTIFPLQQFGGETEGIALYKGQLIMGWRNNANIYAFDF